VPITPALVSLADVADLDLWLTLTSQDLVRLTILAAPGGWLSLAPLLPIGGLVGHATDRDNIGVAMLLPTEAVREGTSPGVVFVGFGPGGAPLAEWLSDQAVEWASRGRPGANELALTVQLAGLVRTAPTANVLRRPSVTIQAGWPA